MRRILAQSLLRYSTDDLWEILTGEFVLVFPDGELRTNARQTLYSSYGWEFQRRFPLAPLLKEHHVQSILKGKRLSSDTHLDLLGLCMKNTYDTYVRLPPGTDAFAIDRDALWEMVYRLTNRMYNDLSYRCEEYVASLDIVDFIEVMDHPEVKAANERLVRAVEDPHSSYKSLEREVDATYDDIRLELNTSSKLDHNPIALGVRSKFAKIDSVLQCVSARMFVTDIDNKVFENVPITRGYAMGLRLFVDSLVESRSAAKSLIFSKTPLQQAEYFSRRLQLMSQIVQRLHTADCGATGYLKWEVRPKLYNEEGKLERAADLKQLVGKYYLDDNGLGQPVPGPLKTITADDLHLEGRVVHMRSVLHCAHPDPYGICSTCFGELSLSVPAGTNIGHMCCTSMTQKSSQSVLSVKHMDSSAAVEGIILSSEMRELLHADDNTYLLSPKLKGKQVTLIISPQQAQKLTDVKEAPDVRDLTLSQISNIDVLFMDVTHRGQTARYHMDVNVGRRLANMTYQLLAYIRKHGWAYNAQNNFTIDMSHWDWEQPILVLPLKHYNMADHSRDIAETLEANVEQMQMRATGLNPDDMLQDFFDLVNSKLAVNLAVLEVTQYGAMIRSAERNDYALPKPGTPRGVGVMSMSMEMRSLAVKFAYEGHRDTINNPLSYVQRNRPDHPLDGIVMPYEVFGSGAVLPAQQ